jgi:O-antigen ligase
MPMRRWFERETWRLDWQLWTLIVVVFTALILLFTSPLAAVACVLLLVAFGGLFWWSGQTYSQSAVLLVPGWLIVGGVVAAYILVSILWSADPLTTLKIASISAALLGGTYMLSRIVELCPVAWLEHVTRTMLVAFLVAVSYFLFEAASDHAVEKAILYPFKAFKVSNAGVESYRVDVIENSIKWRMPSLNFLLWPVLLICALQLDPRQARVGFATSKLVRGLQVTILLAVAGVLYLSGHRTSQVAFVVAVTVFIASSLSRPTWLRRLLGTFWCLAFVGVVPLVLMLFNANLHTDNKFKDNLDQRFVIWATTAELVSNQPLLGVGAAATTLLNNRNFPASEAAKLAKQPYLKRTGPHAHNIYLQSWYELGAIGTLLLLVFGLLVLGATATAPAPTQPYLLATFATVMTTGAASFGLFEVWFMNTFAVCAFAALISVAYFRRLNPAVVPAT